MGVEVLNSYRQVFGFILIFLLFTGWVKAQVTIANSLPGCLPVANQVGVPCGGGTTFFGINGSNQFVVNNVDGAACCPGPTGGGDSESYFEFAELNISGFQNVNLSMNFSAANTSYEDNSMGDPIFGCQGMPSPDNSHDQIIFMYSLDGGPFVQSLYVHGTTPANFTGTWTEGPLNGNNLVVRIYATNKAQAEIFYFSNLLVTGQSTLSAGPDVEGCVGVPTSLTGVGSGTWSGGSGIFANVNNPETTYTPSSSEQGTDITLTFTSTPAYTGCPSTSDQMVITVNDGPDIAITPDPQTCGNAILTASGGITYSWSGGQTPNQPENTFTLSGTYIVTVTDANGCSATASQSVTINSAPIVDITGNTTGCDNVTLTASGGGPGGSYSWSGGSNPSSPTNTFTESGTYVVTVTDGNGCTATGSTTVTVNQGPVGMLTGSGVLCPGQCTTFSFNFTSGSEPFTVNLTANPPGFNLPPVPGITAASTFTVCYQGGGLFPNWNPSTLTLTIPTIFSGSGGISLTGISDGSGCPGMASGSFNLTLTNAPNIQNAGPLTECADSNGEANFDLTSLNGTVTGGNSSLTVTWFEDTAGMDPITNPANYTSGTTTVYVSVSNGACSSPIIPVELIVETGDVPFISMVCAESGTDECTVCAENGLVNLEFTFGDNNSYSVTVRENNSNQTYPGIVSNSIPLTVLGMSNSVFELLNIQPLSGCPSNETYGQIVNVTIVEKPDIDPVSIPPSCDAIMLPPITGTNLSGNQAYYTEPGGNGSIIPVGTSISSSITLYLYDIAAPDCWDEEIVSIIILPPVIFDPIGPLEGCGQVFLPEITGIGVSPNAVYNTEQDGSGVEYGPNATIDYSVTLYVIDLEADPDCIVNNVVVQVTIHSFPVEPSIQIDCQSGNGTGNVTFSSPQDPNISYSLDGGPFQNSPVFNGISNGAHILRYRDNEHECERTLPFTINCDCVKPAFLFIPVYDENVCEGETFTLENAQFGGTATSVTLEHNGTGLLTPTSSDVWPFTIQYIPGVNDLDKEVTISLMTDDPDGFGSCEPATKTLVIKIRSNPDVKIDGIDSICIGGNVTLTASGALSYAWSDNGGSGKDAIYQNINKKDTFFVVGLNAFGCRDTAFHEISTKPFTAGKDSTASFCKSSPTVINLNDFLEGATETGGVWYNGIDVISNSSNFKVTDLPVGNNALWYVLDDAVCGKDTAQLWVEIRNFNNAGNNYTQSICKNQASFDFTAGLGSFDNGGIWIQKSGTQLVLSNPTSVNVSTLAPDKYDFLYVIPDNGCASDTSFVTLNVTAAPNAGMDVTAVTCIGSTIDLLSLVNATDKSGLLINPSAYSGISGTTWNTSGLNAGNYEFGYVLSGTPECKPDTSIIRVTLEAELNPGVGFSGSYCPGSILDLENFIGTQADSGGKFYLESSEITTGTYQTVAGQGTLVFSYVVGDGINCPEQTAFLTFSEQKAPDLSISGLPVICEGKCQDLLLTSSASLDGTMWLRAVNQNNGNEFPVSFQVSDDSQTFKICVSNTGPYDFGDLPTNEKFNIVLDSLSSGGCLFIGNVTFNLETSSSIQKSLSPVLCKGEVFTLGSDTYSASNPSGISKVPSITTMGCDTLVTVNLSFYPEAIGDFKAEFCDDDKTITIGSQTFSKSMPSGTVILPAASINGCDSMVMVSITYTNFIAEGSFVFTTCDPTYTFTAGGVTFDKSNPQGEVVLSGASATGCDSLLKVQIIYTELMADIKLNEGCKDEPSTLVLDAATLPGPYSLLLNDQLSENVPVLPFQKEILPGDYTVVVITEEGCRSAPQQLKVLENLGPDVRLSLSIDPNGVTQMVVSSVPNSIYNLQWSPAEGLSCTDCFAPVATPESTTTYTLLFSYGNDCIDSTKITINRASDGIVIANVFTPDGDGMNDYFYVQLPDNSSGIVKSMRIYDRWGNNVFLADNVTPNVPEAGWGGDFNGTTVQSGVFVYAIEIQLQSEANTRVLYGSVTLMK